MYQITQHRSHFYVVRVRDGKRVCRCVDYGHALHLCTTMNSAFERI